MKFELLRDLINELNRTNSTNDKVSVLSRYDDPFIKRVLLYTHHPLKQYYVTPKNLQKLSHISVDTDIDLFEMLDSLANREVTGHDAISMVNGFIQKHKEYEDIILNILDRNLKVRMSESLINKVFPGLIPTFDVALAQKFDEKTMKLVTFDGSWYASRKLDGIRCIAIIDETGEVKFFSRKGKELYTLGNLVPPIKKLNLRNTVLDGEVCIVDEQGNENFTEIVSAIRRKDYTIENPKYLLFDILKLEEFLAKEGKSPFSGRYNTLRKLVSENKELRVIEQIKLDSDKKFTDLQKTVKKNGWEGLILRKNVTYKGKRTKDMLKVKTFFDDEYTVVDIEVGPFRIIRDGSEVTETVLTNVFIEHKGYKVSVGSGFSIDERRHYKEHPEDILGKTITVSYFEESMNQKGEMSLRFPTVKHVYEDKREV
jgi:DNA ligase-1